jgi:aminoglycoside 3-N-acetyltransferase
VTFLHYAEHVIDIPGKRVARYRVPVDENRSRVWRDVEEFDTSDLGAHPNWPDRFFASLVDAFIAAKRDRGSRVGDALSHLVSARELLDFVLPWMKSVATDASAAQKLLPFAHPAERGRT